MKKLCMLGAVVAVVSLSAHAQDQNELDEVVVTGTRSATDVRHLPLTVTVIDRKAINQTLQPMLLPIITEKVPGLFNTSRGILGYGVSTGAAGSISYRGLSSGSGQMMVLIDGHPQYMGLMGHPIADAYQSLMAERVEVLRGPASVLYGSNAMGGVVNIVTRRMKEQGVRTSANVGYGSYNTLLTELTNQVHYGGFSSFVGATYNRTDGHRDNMDFEQFNGYAKLGYDLTANWTARADINLTHFDASQPGTVTTPMLDADQSITRGMTSAFLENRYDNLSGAVSVFYNWGNHWINDGYSADSNSPLDYRFNSRDRLTGVSVYESAQLFSGNRITLGLDYYHVAGKAWNEYVSGESAGKSQKIVDKKQDELAVYIDIRQAVSRLLTVDAGMRADRHSHIGTEWIPQAGLSLHLPHAGEMKASVSKGFRYPTLREMYMFPPQNPDLQPERMWNYEVSYAQRLLHDRLSYGVNLFYIDGENLIVTVPREGSTPLNVNTGKIDNLGFELQTDYHINRHWSISANYSYLHMKNPVISAPEHKTVTSASYTAHKLSVFTSVQYIHGLYTSVSPIEKESFTLWNLGARYRINRHVGVWARGENLLAQHYEINLGYPMPRATVMLGFDLNF
jgi:iron complex outermembrane receptor protein